MTNLQQVSSQSTTLTYTINRQINPPSISSLSYDHPVFIVTQRPRRTKELTRPVSLIHSPRLSGRESERTRGQKRVRERSAVCRISRSNGLRQSPCDARAAPRLGTVVERRSCRREKKSSSRGCRKKGGKATSTKCNERAGAPITR